MTAVADAGPMTDAMIEAAAPGTWGVFDDHRRDWVVPATLHSEREAWTALLDVDSLWPWMLAVREARPEPVPEPVTPATLVDCPRCDGDGDCDGCGRDCTRCDGDQQLRRDQLTEDELADVDRRDARRAKRRQKEAAREG